MNIIQVTAKYRKFVAEFIFLNLTSSFMSPDQVYSSLLKGLVQRVFVSNFADKLRNKSAKNVIAFYQMSDISNVNQC